MGIKHDIQYLTSLLEASFPPNHPALNALNNMVKAIQYSANAPIMPWRRVLMDATLHDLYDSRWLKPFFDNALVYPCLFYQTELRGKNEMRLTIECKVPYSENIAINQIINIEDAAWHQDDIFRLTLVKMLTDLENMLD